MTKKKSAPEIVEFTEEELESLFLRVDQNTLTEEDKRLVKGAVQSNVWLRHTLEAGKLTLYKLRRLLFGFRSEKRKKTIKEKDKATQAKEEDSKGGSLPLAPNENLISSPEFDEESKSKRKGHGRLGADAYPHAEKVEINHPILKAGDPCPENCTGRLYKIDPGIFIRIAGQNIAKVIRYQAEKFRCALCGLVVTTDLPKGVKEEEGKYDFRFKAILVVQKYFAGVPFFRQEHFQAMLGIPLPDATQWDLIEQVANAVYPVIRVLEEIAASGEVIHNDDTSVRIVEVIRANKKDPTRKRRGIFTSAIFARAGPYEIVLYYSGTKHAGENLSKILKKRPAHLPPIIHMSDALSANLTEEFKNLIAKCLTHGRRQFTDIEIFFPAECAYVINEIGKVYFYDEEVKKEGLSAEKRLAFHQEHLGPVMEDLKKWLDDQIENNLVEPNGGLGKAIRYLRRHWEGLTLFLRVPGSPLDNNICEQMIKIAIRLRKNSLIHKTCHGATVASLLMSLIQTCRLAKVNPVEYLVACQENKKALFKNPSEWLPWNYQAPLNRDLQEIAA